MRLSSSASRKGRSTTARRRCSLRCLGRRPSWNRQRTCIITSRPDPAALVLHPPRRLPATWAWCDRMTLGEVESELARSSFGSPVGLGWNWNHHAPTACPAFHRADPVTTFMPCSSLLCPRPSHRSPKGRLPRRMRRRRNIRRSPKWRGDASRSNAALVPLHPSSKPIVVVAFFVTLAAVRGPCPLSASPSSPRRRLRSPNPVERDRKSDPTRPDPPVPASSIPLDHVGNGPTTRASLCSLERSWRRSFCRSLSNPILLPDAQPSFTLS